MLSLQNVTVRYKNRVALHPLSVELSDGVTALLGPNGAGKTSLLTSIATVNRSARGTIAIDGADLAEKQVRRRYRQQLGVMPQETSTAGHLRVGQFLTYVAWMREVEADDVGHAVDSALDAVGLTDRKHSSVRELSGGMVRRLMFAQALVNDPRVLTLDEPTTGLDPEQRTSLRSLIAEQGRSRVVVLSTHMADDVTFVASRVLVLSEGRILFDGTPEMLASRGAGTSFATSLESGYLAVIRESEARG